MKIDQMHQLLSEDLEPGKAVELSDNIVRIVADNGSVMTGSGTNSYLIGRERLCLVDAGPSSENHCQAILNAAKSRGRIEHIVLTHTHSDHSPGVVALREKTGASIALYPKPSGAPFRDTPVPADQALLHEDYLADFSPPLQALHTPGHASNHLCFYLPEDKILFTGDHLMNGSTVVIASPDGNMSEYIQSLELLKSYDIDYLAPGHGALMDQAQVCIDGTIAHRLKREGKVMEAVSALGSGKLEEILLKAYEDTPSFLHGLAKLSLLAHLEKLHRENRIHCKDGIWLSIE